VAAAVGLAEKLVAHYGLPLSGTGLEMEGLTHVFPRAEHLASADLSVLGTHGRRGVRRLVLGSDAEQVVRTASVPVLLVRA